MYVDQRKNVNHMRVLDDIPIDEGSENEFELMSGGNHNVSYDTKVITLSLLSEC